MSTEQHKAYATGKPLGASSEISDTRARIGRIRAAFAGRDSSLRAWGFAWGRSRGLTTDIELQNAYNTVKRTVERWAARPDVVSRPGTLAAEIMTALRADLGPYVVPPPRERGTPAGGVPAPNERRVSA